MCTQYRVYIRKTNKRKCQNNYPIGNIEGTFVLPLLRKPVCKCIIYRPMLRVLTHWSVLLQSYE
jgi:hypothetical protein